MNCFSVRGDGGHHALAASEARYNEVKQRDIPGTRSNGPPAVRQGFPAVQGLWEYISACDVCMCYICF